VNPIFHAGVEVERFCRSRGYRFCFIGGLAVQRCGEPRLTQVVDLTLLTGFGTEGPFIDGMLGAFRGRIDDARDFALANRVLLLKASNDVPLDISLGAMPFEERSTERATRFDVGEGASLTTCSAEDLVVHKVFAGRAKDWLDVDGIVRRQGAKLDTRLVLDELEPLLELSGDTASVARLIALFDKPSRPRD
jgi:hypothetical protein